MRRAKIFIHGILAGHLIETQQGSYIFEYLDGYTGPPVSLTMPTTSRSYPSERFPSFFDGLLPEGLQLESLLSSRKIDREDHFSQLLIVGRDLVGSVTVEEDT